MAREVAAVADVFVMTSDNPRSESPDAIISDMQAGLVDDESGAPGLSITNKMGNKTFTRPDQSSCAIEVIVDRQAAIGWAINMATGDDVVVIAGKGHETTQEFADHTIEFDDRVVARQWIDRREATA
jgi:UDP-N-acetylmuramoyl-L-alanyl-D-glutamate--2,6-diaminopimelate ligase